MRFKRRGTSGTHLAAPAMRSNVDLELALKKQQLDDAMAREGAAAVGGGVVGAILGMVGGAPGAVVGAVLGAALGATIEDDIEHVVDARHARDEALDRGIGVIGGDIGSK